MDKKSVKSFKYNNIEAIRFLFAVIIVYFHILHSNIMDFTGGKQIYQTLADLNQFAGIIVECFFILSGFFLYYSYYKKPQMSVKEFAYGKVARLLPVFLFSELICALMHKRSLGALIFNSLFLQCTGLSTEWKGINWYISPLFWVLVFYFVLIKCLNNDKRRLNIIIGVITYFSYVILLNNGGFKREITLSFLSGGVLRALAGIGLGYLIAVCVESIKEMPSVKGFKPNKKQNALITVVISLVEAACFIGLIIDFLYKKIAYENQFIVVILFSGLLLCMITRKGILSRICNNKFFGSFGKYAYSIYVMQQVTFYLLQKTLWTNSDFVQNHAYRCIAVSILFSVLFGIATYYVIEKPCARLFKKLGKKLFPKKTVAE